MEIRDMSPKEIVYTLRNHATQEIESHVIGPFYLPEQAESALARLCGQDRRGSTFLGAEIRPVAAGSASKEVVR